VKAALRPLLNRSFFRKTRAKRQKLQPRPNGPNPAPYASRGERERGAVGRRTGRRAAPRADLVTGAKDLSFGVSQQAARHRRAVRLGDNLPESLGEPCRKHGRGLDLDDVPWKSSSRAASRNRQLIAALRPAGLGWGAIVTEGRRMVDRHMGATRAEKPKRRSKDIGQSESARSRGNADFEVKLLGVTPMLRKLVPSASGLRAI